jgi:hypothetical protein
MKQSLALAETTLRLQPAGRFFAKLATAHKARPGEDDKKQRSISLLGGIDVGPRVIAAETSLPGGGSTAGHVLQFSLIHAESGAPTPEQRGLCPRKHLAKGGKSYCGRF